MSISKEAVQYLFHTSFRQILPLTASKILVIRQYVRSSFLFTRMLLLENPHPISMPSGLKLLL